MQCLTIECKCHYWLASGHLAGTGSSIHLRLGAKAASGVSAAALGCPAAAVATAASMLLPPRQRPPAPALHRRSRLACANHTQESADGSLLTLERVLVFTIFGLAGGGLLRSPLQLAPN